jgi:hypothetical protein
MVGPSLELFGRSSSDPRTLARGCHFENVSAAEPAARTPMVFSIVTWRALDGSPWTSTFSSDDREGHGL